MAKEPTQMTTLKNVLIAMEQGLTPIYKMDNSADTELTLTALRYTNAMKAQQTDGHANHDGTCSQCARDAALRIAAFIAGYRHEQATKQS